MMAMRDLANILDFVPRRNPPKGQRTAASGPKQITSSRICRLGGNAQLGEFGSPSYSKQDSEPGVVQAMGNSQKLTWSISCGGPSTDFFRPMATLQCYFNAYSSCTTSYERSR